MGEYWEVQPTTHPRGQGPGPPSRALPATRGSARTQQPPASLGLTSTSSPTQPCPPSQPLLTGCLLCGNIALAAAAALLPGNSILRSISNFNPAEVN